MYKKNNASLIKRLTVLSISSLLFGCGEHTRVEISDAHVDMIGAWQTRHENVQENSTHIDNMLLLITQKGQATYRKCEVKKNISETNRTSSRYVTDFPDAVVTSISKKEIVLYKAFFDIDWLGIDWSINIDKPPYQSGGDWYMDVEGKQLKKLSPDAFNNDTNWICPERDEENEVQEQEFTV